MDYWAHRFADDPKLKDEMVTDDFEQEMKDFERESAASLAGHVTAAPTADQAAAVPEDDWEPVVARTYGGAR